jgi:deoxycitidine kinase/deoxyguanosine kinase
MAQPILISIDGNIGAGKSTFLRHLKDKYPEWHFIDEPVDAWTKFKNSQDESLLEVFYKDRHRWSYTFQNCALLTRVRAITKAIKEWQADCKLNPEKAKHNIFITERCVETDYNVFAKMLHDDNSLDKLEWDLYRQWYRFLIQSSNVEVEGIIYVNCSPKKCLERITHRAREGESIIPLDYLTNLHNYHKNWIENTTVPVLDINTECDGYEYPMEEVMKYVSRL